MRTIQFAAKNKAKNNLIFYLEKKLDKVSETL